MFSILLKKQCASQHFSEDSEKGKIGQLSVLICVMSFGQKEYNNKIKKLERKSEKM